MHTKKKAPFELGDLCCHGDARGRGSKVLTVGGRGTKEEEGKDFLLLAAALCWRPGRSSAGRDSFNLHRPVDGVPSSL